MQIETDIASRPRSTPAPRRIEGGAHPVGRGLVAVVIAGMAVLGGACSQDTSEGGTTPEDQPTGGPQQPGGGDDPSLSGEGSDGVGDGNTGGDGSGAPDSGSGDSGSAGQSPTAGEDG